MRTNGTNTSINFDTLESKTLLATSAIVIGGDIEEIRLTKTMMVPTIIKRPKITTKKGTKKNSKNLRNKSLPPHHLPPLLLSNNINTKEPGKTIRVGATNTSIKEGTEGSIIINNQNNHHRSPSPPQITHIQTTMWRMLEEHYWIP
jgi:hypothetical protein